MLFDKSADVNDIILEMHEGSGVCTIEDFVPIDRCAALMAIVNSYEPDEYGGIRCLLDKSPIFEEIVTDQTIFDICSALFRVEFRLTAFGARTMAPSGSVDPRQDRLLKAHIDHPYREVIAGNEGEASFYRSVPLGLQILIPLVDLTIDTGATAYIPGSQKWYRMADHDEFKQRDLNGETARLIVPAGSLNMWSGPIWHAACANLSKAPRTVMTMLYSPAFVKQPHLMRDIFSKEFFATTSDRFQKLLGVKDLYPMTFSQPRKVS